MKNILIAVLLGLGFSHAAFTQSVHPTAVTTDSVPILAKVWTGVAGDTSIGAISRKNPLHYLHVGEAKQVKGWNTYDSPASLTVIRQEGRHLELQFKNPKYQINEVATLSADGKQIQIASKEATGLFTIEGDKITGCGTSQGTNGLFGHWLGSYSAWCDEYTVGTSVAPTSKKTIATLPKVWTGILSSTNFGGPTRHVPNHEANAGKKKADQEWTTHDETPRTLTILRQEGRHIEFNYKSSRAETKFIGMLSADGKQMQVSSGYSVGIWDIVENKISGCAFSRGMEGSFMHWFNNYQTYCVDFIAGTSPPTPPQNVPILPKEWRGMIAHTNFGDGGKYNTNAQPHSDMLISSYIAPRTLIIQEQDGRHLKMIYKTDTKTFPLIGTLSSDGKQIAIANNYTAGILNIAKDSLTGCATSRGATARPTFEKWKESYAAWCVKLAPSP